ncbi:MAG: single-stranded DNA-binding protein [Bacteroidales bacterium]|jgi:single-strand DNA-binding protein
MEHSINKVELLGRVGADPRTGQTEDGRKVINFSLATGEVLKTSSGELREETTWHRIVAWEGKELTVTDFEKVKKGSRLAVTGRIRTNTYEKDGQQRYTQEIIAQTLKNA